jgi:hypothetical protein
MLTYHFKVSPITFFMQPAGTVFDFQHLPFPLYDLILVLSPHLEIVNFKSPISNLIPTFQISNFKSEISSRYLRVSSFRATRCYFHRIRLLHYEDSRWYHPLMKVGRKLNRAEKLAHSPARVIVSLAGGSAFVRGRGGTSFAASKGWVFGIWHFVGAAPFEILRARVFL